MPGTGLGPMVPLWCLHSNGKSKTLNNSKISNLSMLGTVALKEQDRVLGKHETVWAGTHGLEPISLLSADLPVGPLTTALDLSQLSLAQFVFSFNLNMHRIWTSKGLLCDV